MSQSSQQADWTCVAPGGSAAGNVKIWWGYTPGDAAWACNNWVSTCGNAAGGGCTAVPGTLPPGAVVAVSADQAPAPTAPTATPPSAPVPLQPGQLHMTGDKVPPVVSWQGKQAFHVTYKGGEIHGGATNCNVRFNPAGVFPATQCRARFSVWLADNFPFVKQKGKSIGGKFGGFEIGQGVASGARYSTTGATYRVTFHPGGTLTGYLYPEMRRAFVGRSASWAQEDQSPELQSVSVIQSGVHVWHDNTDLALKKGQWNDIDMFMKLNTPGKYDGVMELTVNGVTKRLDSVRYRYDNATINAFHLSTFFGGGTKKFAPPEDTAVWFADYAFSDYR